MIGVGRRISSNTWVPVKVTQMLNIDNHQISHCMMVRAKGDQVGKCVSPTIGKRGDMVDMNMEIEPANDAFITISDHGLLFNKFPFTTLPVAVEVRHFWVSVVHALTIAIVSFLHLAREFLKHLTAVMTRDINFIYPSRFCGHALPFEIAIAIATRNLVHARPLLKGIAANRARNLFLTAFIVSVVLSAMLVLIYVYALMPTFLSRNHFAATTSTENRCFIF